MTTVSILTQETCKLTSKLAATLECVLMISTIGAGSSCVAAGLYEPTRFFASYLVALLTALTIALGALFWVMVHHVTGSVWSVVIRRLLEQMSRAILLLAVLFVPLLFGMQQLYPWMDTGHQTDLVLKSKQAYLNIPFFLCRVFIYFAIWAFLAYRLTRLSIKQDGDGNTTLSRQMRNLSGPGIPLLAVTSSFAAFDWIMSLDPHWYSTIFGIYFWAGAIVSSLSALIIIVIGLLSQGMLKHIVTEEHLHDLGKLLFGFVVFWTYIAFSQYFLIWYGNIPEETSWYVRRAQGGWRDVGLSLIAGHFAIPFIVLLGRSAKRNTSVLGSIALLVLGFHYVDLYWQIMPELRPEGPDLNWIDAVTLLAVFSTVGLMLVRVARQVSLIPIRDPQLQASLGTLSD